MSCAVPAPYSESERLEKLSKLAILDTPSEQGFEAIVELAQRLFRCSIALVSFIDRDRQWSKACRGVSAAEIPRNYAFCAHAILQSEITVVEDASHDPRFRDNPLVVGEPQIRFYAGAPLHPVALGGLDTAAAIGTLCIADRNPRSFSPKDGATLRVLAGLVEDLLNARLAAASTRKSAVEVQNRAIMIDRKNRQLRQAERMAGIGSWRLDLQTNQLEWSDQVFAIHELPTGDPLQLDRALSFYGRSDRRHIATLVERAINTGEAFNFECDFTTAKGAARRVRALGELELIEGKAAALVGVFQDVTDRHNHQRSLEQSANTDSLTELPNRRAFQTALQQIFTSESGFKHPALCLLDVDHFKSVNDQHGHVIGDALLREIARRVRTVVPVDAVVARLGGDEFAILLPHVGSDLDLDALTGAIVEAVHRPLTLQGVSLWPTVSIGATFIEPAQTAETTLSQADEALYQAKRAGRNQASLFNPSSCRRHGEHISLLSEVRAGLESGAFEAYYQPIVDLRTHVVRGWEALIRWNHSAKGLLHPGSFLPALEDPATSVLIDDFMLNTGLRQMRQWLDAAVPVTCVGVNVSDTQLRRPDLVPTIKAALAKYELSPDRLKLEVLETAFVGRSTQHVAATIRRLAEHGVVSALDDFGTGHASLTHLKQFRVKRIKLDRSFVANLGADCYDQAIIRCMIALGRDLGMRVTAEGIETVEQLRMLQHMGCDCGQGYLLGRPMPAVAVPDFLARWHGGVAERLLGRMDKIGPLPLRLITT